MAESTPFSVLLEQPVLGVTMGDLAGIGPEIVVKALRDPEIRKAAKFIVFGMHEQLTVVADRLEIEPYWRRVQHEKIGRDYASKVVLADFDDVSLPPRIIGSTGIGGASSLAFVKDAIFAAQHGIIDGIVTGPISKTSWKMAGLKWAGHTELFAEKCKSPRKTMMVVSPPLKLALAAIHDGLFEGRHKFTIGSVYEPIDLLNTALKDYFDIEHPRIGVAALNPNGGEDGQFGDEEQRIIAPAILLAQEQGILCDGPYSADTLFLRTVRGEFDAAVAMYYDQGMIPAKLLAPNEAVSVTLGIPIIRTSPCQGTAFDIVGKNQADPSAMMAAIKTAIHMVRTRRRLLRRAHDQD
jgi:4-hydroxythreonine-4-phosphate dehydrogenase